MNKFTNVTLKVIPALLLSSLLLIGCSCGKDGPSSGDRGTGEITEEIMSYFGTYGSDEERLLEERLRELDERDPVEGAKWRSIIELWKYSNNDLTLNYDTLPDGLPETDGFCMVVLGYCLNQDGTMRDELVGRLTVAKASAEKYPNAFVLCTGGPTATMNRQATEAEAMGQWLRENGIAEERIIIENQSLTTAQNANFSLNILEDTYPQINQLAIISSDYHIATGHLLFGAGSILRAPAVGREKYKIISNAAYRTSTGALSVSFQASALKELSGDRERQENLNGE